MQKILYLFVSFFLTTSNQTFAAYYQNETGLHLDLFGTTDEGNEWRLREYQSSDLNCHWEIIQKNTGKGKQYSEVDAASFISVQKRRNRSLEGFKKGRPWGMMTLLDGNGKCIGIVGLGLCVGKEGKERLEHGHLGITFDVKENRFIYSPSLLQALTKNLFPEILQMGDPRIKYVDATLDIAREELWRPLLKANFVFDTEDAIDLRTKTIILAKSSYQTLSDDFHKIVPNPVLYQRYLITGPSGENLVIWSSEKWGGIKICLVNKIAIH